MKTVNQEQIALFNETAEAWWQEDGSFKAIHQMNPLRISYMKALTVSHFHLPQNFRPFEGLRFLDVGCGGGILCEPLKRLGANVTGIDASGATIEVAKDHASEQVLDITYIQTTLEDFQNDHPFHVITALEIMEHVEQLDLFIENIAKRLASNGLFFFSTINRNWISYLGAIVVAEYVTRWVPIGTHTFEKFIKPSELSHLLNKNHMHIKSLKGMRFKPWGNPSWKLNGSPTVNYIGCASF